MKSSSKTDSQGHPVLYHGAPWFIVSYASFSLGIFMMLIPFLTNESSNFAGWIVISAIAIVLFFLPGVLILLDALKVRFTITEEGVFAEAPWPGYPKKVLWSDVKSVSYSALSGCLAIDDHKYHTLRVSPYFYGITSFCEYLKKYVSPEKIKRQSFLAASYFLDAKLLERLLVTE